MNELMIYNHEHFGQVRTVDIDGKRGLVATDVAKALGYKDAGKAIRQHCKGGVKHPILTNGGIQNVSVIFKPDLYRLAANSELPGADEFESWIFDEVLVSIDEFGAYMTPDKIQEVLMNPDTIITLATQLKDFQERNRELEGEIDVQRQIIGELKPKADYVDYILSSRAHQPNRQDTFQLQYDGHA